MYKYKIQYLIIKLCSKDLVIGSYVLYLVYLCYKSKENGFYSIQTSFYFTLALQHNVRKKIVPG